MEKAVPVLSDVEVDFYKWDAAPGSELPIQMTVSNPGMVAAQALRVVIKDGETELLTKTVEETVLPGETKTLSLSFVLPNEVVKKDYTLEVTPIAASEGTPSAVNFTVGESYYELEKTNYCINGKTMVVISIRNIGFEPGSGTLEIFDNTGTDGIYECFDFSGLEYGNVLNYKTTVDNLDWDSFAVKAIGVRVMQQGKAASDTRTITLFKDQAAEVTGVAVNKMRTNLTGIGAVEQLTAEVFPKDGVEAALVWSSSAPEIVSVDQTGKITALQSGSAIIQVSLEDGSYYSRCLVTVESVSSALPFEDIAETDWFYEAVSYNFNEGIMTGMDDTHFGPYVPLSRAQFATILYRMEGSPEIAVTSVFGDIQGNEWYAKPVLWAYQNKIVTGYENGMFGPGDMITREQMAVMMFRYANYISQHETQSLNEDFHSFADASSVSTFASEAIQWAIGSGIITGKENGTKIDPQGNTARAEAAVIIQRFMK